jgi:hypothetical protein
VKLRSAAVLFSVLFLVPACGDDSSLKSCPSGAEALAWETTGGGSVTFQMIRVDNKYAFHVTHYNFHDVNIEFDLKSDENPTAFHAAHELLNSGVRQREERPGLLTGTWTNITFMCKSGKPVTVYPAIAYEGPAAIVSGLVSYEVNMRR